MLGIADAHDRCFCGDDIIRDKRRPGGGVIINGLGLSFT